MLKIQIFLVKFQELGYYLCIYMFMQMLCKLEKVIKVIKLCAYNTESYWATFQNTKYMNMVYTTFAPKEIDTHTRAHTHMQNH